MNFAEQYQFRHGNDTFWQRAEEAILVVASAIRVESEGTANHVKRLAWAKEAELAPETKLAQMRNRITTHWAIQSLGAAITDVTDGANPGIRQVIESLVDDFATT